MGAAEVSLPLVRQSLSSTQAPARRRRARGHALVVLALLALTALLYGGTLDDGWHLDDRAELEWPGVRDGSPVVSSGHYRGLVSLWLWAANFRISGEDPWSYHLVNLLIHFVNATLVYALAWRWKRPSDPARRLFAVTAAVVFAAHPVATQAVTYVAQRSTSLATMFLLASLLGWIAFRDVAARGRWLAASVTVATFALGLHTKPVVLAWPALALGVERWRAPRRALDRGAVAVLLVLAVLATWRASEFAPRIARWFSANPATVAMPQNTAGPDDAAPRYSPANYARTQPRVVATYIRLLIWPSGQNIDHDVLVTRSVADTRFVAPAILLLALVALGLIARHRTPIVAFGILVFFATLAPTSSVFPSRDLLFEHRTYASVVGFALVVGEVAARAPMRGRRAWLAPLILALGLGVVTLHRNAVWDTELSLWRDAAAKSPGKARPHLNLGLALQNAGRLDEAAAEYGRALAIRPGHPLALNNLGNVCRTQGNAASAERLFREAIAADSTYAEPWINLGNLAMDRRDPTSAETFYRGALARDRRSLIARYDLAKSLELQQRHVESVAEYEKVAATRPNDPLFANDLGCARLAAGDVAGAERDLRRAVALDDRWPVAWYNLGLALQARGAQTEAVAAFEAALSRDPGLEPARARLRLLHESGGAEP